MVCEFLSVKLLPPPPEKNSDLGYQAEEPESAQALNTNYTVPPSETQMTTFQLPGQIYT